MSAKLRRHEISGLLVERGGRRIGPAPVASGTRCWVFTEARLIDPFASLMDPASPDGPVQRVLALVGPPRERRSVYPAGEPLSPFR